MSDIKPPLAKDVIDISPEQLLIAISKVKAVSHHAEIAPSIAIVNAAAKTLLDVQQQLSKPGSSVLKLRRFLGVFFQKEESADIAKGDGEAGAAVGKCDKANGGEQITSGDDTSKPSDKSDENKKGRHNHGRRGKSDFPDAEQRYFVHPDFDKPGCSCPECLAAKVYLMGSVGGGIRFSGQSSIKATGLNYEIWRCGDCGAHFPAPLPMDIQDDGGLSRFGYSASAIISIFKYLYGTPWARQERIGSMMDIDLPDSTQWEQSYRTATAALPVYERFFIEAAMAFLYFSDDTGNKILNLKFEVKTQRSTGEAVLRTGVHTACVVAVLPDGKEIVIYKTGIIHAGELMDEILIHRPKELQIPYHMSDGHSANPPTVCPVIAGECNSHARRKVEEKQTSWEKVWHYIKSVYEHVYKFEKLAKTQNLSQIERMELHRRESHPRMKEMFRWMQDCLNNKTVEPNSNLGGVFEYFLTREKGLTAFCFHPGFPIDNNRCENAQKLVALHRKNAEFFRSLRGALTGDVIMSIGATLQRNGGNILHYFSNMQRYSLDVEKRPQDFMPWNYIDTIKKIEMNHPQQTRWREVSETEFLERQVSLRSTQAWGKAKNQGNKPADAANRSG